MDKLKNALKKLKEANKVKRLELPKPKTKPDKRYVIVDGEKPHLIFVDGKIETKRNYTII
jgi:hypothetical protein